jgi:Na+/H+ antiporter NhaC
MYFYPKKVQANFMRVILISLFSFSFLLCSFAQNDIESTDAFNFNVQDVVVQHIPVQIEVFIPKAYIDSIGRALITINDSTAVIIPLDGKFIFTKVFHQKEELTIGIGSIIQTKKINPIPIWTSVLPPLIAILFALLFREVYSALFTGLLVGSVIITYYQGFPFFMALFYGLFSIIDVYIIQSLNDYAHLSIIVFSLMIGAMVTLISQNGGMQGVVNILARYAHSPRSGQLVTWMLGMAIFFDDYANTLIVGNTMRPVTDRLKISREKLSYIVDSTAAPVAALALTTTWIGIELAYIQEGINAIGLNESAYMIFVQSLTTRFYPILTLVFVIIIIFKGRDFGPMLKAERNARLGIIDEKNKTHQPESELPSTILSKARWYNAGIPVILVVFVTFTGLIITGWDWEIWNNPDISYFTKFMEIVGRSDSYKALLWASFTGMFVAISLTVSQRIFNFRKSIEYILKGFSTMLPAVLILILAWSLALITQNMHTADFLARVLTNMHLSPYVLPAITFVLAALIAFSTGSSWGTMAILYPLILPVSWIVSQENGLDYDASLAIFNNVVSSILAGSVFGDHCSPISDTTILSSLASSCNHIEHVRTQLPYALIVGVVGTLFGTLPAAYGVPFYILFPLNIAILYLIVVVFGKRVSTA